MYSSSGKKLVGFQRGTSHSHIYIYWWFFLGAFVYYSFLVGSTGCDLLTPPVETAGVAQHAKDWTKQRPSLSFSLFFYCYDFHLFPPFSSSSLCASISFTTTCSSGKERRRDLFDTSLVSLWDSVCTHFHRGSLIAIDIYIYFFPVYIDWFSPPRNEKLEMIRKRKLIRFFYYEIMSTGLNPISFHFLSWCDSCYLLLKVNLVGLRLAAIRNPNSQELKGCCSSCAASLGFLSLSLNFHHRLSCRAQNMIQ